MDNYAIFKAIRKYLRKKLLYKVIKEGNYTSFGGLYGMFFKYCNTLPLSSNLNTMKKFLSSVDILLQNYKLVKIGATAVVMCFNFITRKIFLEKK